MRKYFAYGSCINVESFKETMKSVGCEDKFTILGVGTLEDYRLAFTRKSIKWDGGVLDLVESSGDHVLGVVFEIPNEAVSAIDKREGAPVHYKRIDSINVKLGWEEVEVFTYTVTNKDMKEVKPTREYVDTVLNGMKKFLPVEYINKYFIEHCRHKFDIELLNEPITHLYHFNERHETTEYQRRYGEFYELLRQMAMYMGDDDERVESIRPTPQMFRLVVKCAEIAARNKLDYGHGIPRGLHNILAMEFERLTGVKTERLPDA